MKGTREKRSVGREQHYKRAWAGGYVIQGSRGLPLYIIQRSIKGKRITRSTGARTGKGALEQLARFEADPLNYEPPSAFVAKTQSVEDRLLSLRQLRDGGLLSAREYQLRVLALAESIGKRRLRPGRPPKNR